MELVFGYLAGLLTLINPCVLPVLPIVLGSSLQASKYGPLAMATGMSLTFVVFGMFVAVVGQSIGLTTELLAQIGSVMMIAFGVILIVPQFAHRFELATAGAAAGADSRFDDLDRTGLRGQFIGGTLLGLIWSPCIGPTLGGAISLASQGQSLIWSFLIMVSFSLGVSSIIVALGYGTRKAIMGRQAQLRKFAQGVRPLMGAIFIAVGLMIYFNFNYVIEGWLLDVLPIWLQDFSVAL